MLGLRVLGFCVLGFKILGFRVERVFNHLHSAECDEVSHSGLCT